jgi:hypothetical protein
MRDNERWVIGLRFGKKKNINYYYSSHELSQRYLKLNSFNYQVRLARLKIVQIKLARIRAKPELNYKVKLFCAAIPLKIL